MVSKASPLIKLLKLMDEIYDSKEQEEKEKGRGRPKVYSQITILKVFVVMILKKIKTFKGLYRYLEQNPTVCKHCGLPWLPDRRTLGRRLKSISPSGEGAD